MAVKLDQIKQKLSVLREKTNAFKVFVVGSKEILGIDIGSYAVKIAEFKQGVDGLALRNWGYIPLDARPETTPEEKKAQVINELRAFLIKKDIKSKDAATALSGNSVIVRYVKFPRLTKSELAATLATEAEPFIPFDINEVQLGCHILNEITEEGQKKMETVLVAAKKDLVTSRLEILQGAGLTPAIIDVDSFALENVFERLYDPKAAQAQGVGATLYLNIGHMVTNLSIIDGGVTRVVRDIFIAGNALTKAIMKSLQVDFAKAEELKKRYGILVDAAEKEKALQEGQREALSVSQTVAGVVKDIVGEVHRSVDFYLSQGPERSIARIVLMGGVARLRNLANHLSVELKVPVGVLEPFSFLKTAPADLSVDLTPAFGVAVGLGLRSNRDWL